MIFQQFPCGLLRVLSAPFRRQPSTHRRSQHRLAEAFEYLRDAFEAGFGVFRLGQQGVEFVGDDFLFGEGSYRYGNFIKMRWFKIIDIGACGERRDSVAVIQRVCKPGNIICAAFWGCPKHAAESSETSVKISLNISRFSDYRFASTGHRDNYIASNQLLTAFD